MIHIHNLHCPKSCPPIMRGWGTSALIATTVSLPMHPFPREVWADETVGEKIENSFDKAKKNTRQSARKAKRKMRMTKSVTKSGKPKERQTENESGTGA